MKKIKLRAIHAFAQPKTQKKKKKKSKHYYAILQKPQCFSKSLCYSSIRCSSYGKHFFQLNEGLHGPKPIQTHQGFWILTRLAENRLMNKVLFLVLIVKSKFSHATEKSFTTCCISSSLYAQRTRSEAHEFCQY